MDRILLTGGLGYVGSHTAALLAEKGEDFLIYDNFVIVIQISFTD